jgi:hypothetical protein
VPVAHSRLLETPEELKGQMEKEVELNEEIKKQLNKIGIKI